MTILDDLLKPKEGGNTPPSVEDKQDKQYPTLDEIINVRMPSNEGNAGDYASEPIVIPWKLIGKISAGIAAIPILAFIVINGYYWVGQIRLDSAAESYREDVNELIVEVREEAAQRKATEAEMEAINKIAKDFNNSWWKEGETVSNAGGLTVEGIERFGDEYISALNAALVNIPTPEKRAEFEAAKKAEAERIAKAKADAKAKRQAELAAQEEERAFAKATAQYADYFPHWEKQLKGYNAAKADAEKLGLQVADAPQTPTIDGLTTSAEVYAQNQKIYDFVKGNSISTIRQQIKNEEYRLREEKRKADNAKRAEERSLQNAQREFTKQLGFYNGYANEYNQYAQKLASIGVTVDLAPKPPIASVDSMKTSKEVLAAVETIKKAKKEMDSAKSAIKKTFWKHEKEYKRQQQGLDKLARGYYQTVDQYNSLRNELISNANRAKSQHPVLYKHWMAIVPKSIDKIDFKKTFPSYNQKAVDGHNAMIDLYNAAVQIKKVQWSKVLKDYNKGKLK